MTAAVGETISKANQGSEKDGKTAIEIQRMASNPRAHISATMATASRAAVVSRTRMGHNSVSMGPAILAQARPAWKRVCDRLTIPLVDISLGSIRQSEDHNRFSCAAVCQPRDGIPLSDSTDRLPRQQPMPTTASLRRPTILSPGTASAMAVSFRLHRPHPPHLPSPLWPFLRHRPSPRTGTNFRIHSSTR